MYGRLQHLNGELHNWMAGYSTTDGRLQHNLWLVTAPGCEKKVIELYPEDEETILGIIKLVKGDS